MSYPLIHTIHKEKEKKEQKKKEKPLLLSLIKREHFYLAQKRTFLNCVDKNFKDACRLRQKGL